MCHHVWVTTYEPPAGKVQLLEIKWLIFVGVFPQDGWTYEKNTTNFVVPNWYFPKKTIYSLCETKSHHFDSALPETNSEFTPENMPSQKELSSNHKNAFQGRRLLLVWGMDVYQRKKHGKSCRFGEMF